MLLFLLSFLLRRVSAKTNCAPGQWESWSTCSATCGATGTQERNRKIDILPTADGIQCNVFKFREESHCNRRCFHNGVVSETLGVCVCSQGYTGNCCEIDVNECENANGGCQQKCVNMEGSYYCACFDGFEFTRLRNGQDVCQDTNECETDNGGCEKMCMNYAGGYSCGCIPPKVLEMDGKTCADENFCFTNPEAFNCTHHCVVHRNQFQCECPEGFILDESTYKCTDVDECMSSSFCTGGSCTNIDGKALCNCGAGRGLDVDGMQCMDVDECQPGYNSCSHTCKNVNAGHVCLCPAGMVIGNDHRTCEDENECQRDPLPCSHKCRNLELSFACLCPEKMELEADNRTCCDIGKCIAPLSGSQGRNASDKLVISFSVLAVVAVLVMIVVVWRTLRRTVSSNEKVVRAMKHGDIPDVYYNHNAESMEMESRSLGLGAATKAEPYQTFQRKNARNGEQGEHSGYQ